MNFELYLNYFNIILNDPAPEAPYNNADYLNYTKLNWSRMNRWLKTGELTDGVKEVVSKISAYQKWIIITEPWCGDAAHIIPFLYKMALLNPLIDVEYELRDYEPFRINSYLTNGGKAIPKLIIKNENGDDLASWGPRPAKCQALYLKMKAEHANTETLKTELQNWYNNDKGKEIQTELAGLLLSL